MTLEHSRYHTAQIQASFHLRPSLKLSAILTLPSIQGKIMWLLTSAKHDRMELEERNPFMQGKKMQ